MTRLRPDGSVLSLVEKYLVEHPDARPREVATMLGHKGSAAASRALRELRGWSSERDRRFQEREQQPQVRAELARVSSSVPDVLSAILGQFGSVSGADLTNIYIAAAGLHNHGHPIVRDSTGQIYELTELTRGPAAHTA